MVEERAIEGKETGRSEVREKEAHRDAGRTGEDNRTGRSEGEQRVLIDTAVLIPSNSFYFIRFRFPSYWAKASNS